MRRRRALIGVVSLAIAITVIFAAWVIIVPHWEFVVTTDKSSYRLGEEVHINVTLTNHVLTLEVENLARGDC